MHQSRFSISTISEMLQGAWNGWSWWVSPLSQGLVKEQIFSFPLYFCCLQSLQCVFFGCC